jgi:hypothetical protein
LNIAQRWCKKTIYEWTLEPISKMRLGFRARRGTVKKRSIHVVCEHFEPFHNATMGTKIVFEIGSNKPMTVLCSGGVICFYVLFFNLCHQGCSIDI